MSIAHQINIAAAQKNIPLSAQLEVTTRCNQNCYYCYNRPSLLNKAELSLTQWESVLKDLRDLGCLYLTITGGEPFLRDDIFELLELARRYRFAVSIISNGSLIDKAKARLLKDLGIMDVGISLLAFDEKLHDTLANVSRSYQKALSAIDNLKSNDVKVLVKHSISTENIGEFKKIQQFCDAQNIGFEYDTMIIPSKSGEVSIFDLTSYQQKVLYQDINVSPMKSCKKEDFNNALHCDAGRSVVGIMACGEVRPCILLPVEIGNINTMTLKEIWHSKAMSSFRIEEESLSDDCNKCTINMFCSRCHAVAAMETLSWKSKAPALCKRAELMAALFDEKAVVDK